MSQASKSQVKASTKSSKKSKKGKNKLTKYDIGEPTDFEYIRGSNRHVQDILRQAGVTKKNLQNSADRAIIDYFIELTCVDDFDNDEPANAANTAPLLTSISESPVRKPAKRPTQPPPPPPSVKKLAGPTGPMTGPPPPPLPPPMCVPAAPPLVKATSAVPKSELPAVSSGIDALLNEIKNGLKLKSIEPNQRVSIRRADSNVVAHALKKALQCINDAARDSSSEDDDTEHHNWQDDV